jgi:anti-sigma factor ChrR (cupin superfamily)
MAAQHAGTPSRLIAVNDFEWQERMPGVQARNLWADEETNRLAIMTRLAPGLQMPLHKHVGDELVYIIEGSLFDEFGTITAGNMGYRPNGCVHTVSSTTGATAIAILTGGIEPTTERGDAPPSQVFCLSELEWVDARPGIRLKHIWEDKAAERRVVLARFEPGAVLPLHRHHGDELIFLIEGENADESGPVPTGNLSYRPNGCTHTVTSANGATALNFVWGSAEMLE